jgi:NTP pyrophosphatase (non-canonical NTP hydrolase)
MEHRPMNRADKQLRLRAWGTELFGEETATTPRTRVLRFVEEALELGQAFGLTVDDLKSVSDMVFSRPEGEPHQEIGGVMVTLYLLAEINGLSVEQAEDDEIARIHTPEVMDKCRRRQAEKKALGL